MKKFTLLSIILIFLSSNYNYSMEHPELESPEIETGKHTIMEDIGACCFVAGLVGLIGLYVYTNATLTFEADKKYFRILKEEKLKNLALDLEKLGIPNNYNETHTNEQSN